MARRNRQPAPVQPPKPEYDNPLMEILDDLPKFCSEAATRLAICRASAENKGGKVSAEKLIRQYVEAGKAVDTDPEDTSARATLEIVEEHIRGYAYGGEVACPILE